MSSTLAARGRQPRALVTRAAILQAAATEFALRGYSDTRLKDIAERSGIALGSVYFHFGNKDDLAVAVLDEQRREMTAVLVRWLDSPEPALARLIGMLDQLAHLIATEPLMQGGLRLIVNLPESLSEKALVPHLEIGRVIERLISTGVTDGSMHHQLDVSLVAEVVCEWFVGCEVSAGAADSWASLPHRVRRLHDVLRSLLMADLLEHIDV